MVHLFPPFVADHLARHGKDPLSVARFERVGLADDLDDLALELLLGLEEALPQVVADLSALEQGREGRLCVADRPDEFDVVHRAAEEGRDEDRTRRGRVEREERHVDVARLVLREPWLGGGFVFRERKHVSSREKDETEGVSDREVSNSERERERN